MRLGNFTKKAIIIFIQLLFFMTTQASFSQEPIYSKNGEVKRAKEELCHNDLSCLAQPNQIISRSAQLEAAKDLLENGADVNVRAEDGRTALMVATENCDQDFVKLLLRFGADANIRDEEGKKAFVYLYHCEYSGLTDLLFEKTNLEKEDVRFLNWFVDNGRIKAVELFLQKGKGSVITHADINAAFVTAVRRGYFRIAILLLYNGADIKLIRQLRRK